MQIAEQELAASIVQKDFEQTKAELDAAKEQATLLDKKYNKAKKLIKEFQQRLFWKLFLFLLTSSYCSTIY